MSIWFYLFIIASIIIIALIIKIFVIKNAIKEIEEKFDFIIESDTNNLITISTNDIDLKQLAKKINQNLKKIRELEIQYNQGNEELKRSITNISHDLRTPLTMIRGYAELMKDIPGENNSDNLQIIIDETNRLSNLVTDILDVSKLQSGVMKINETEFSITDTVNSVLNRYRRLKELEGYKIEFESDKNVYIKADAIKMSQVVYNLLNNAINYTGEDKKITVRQIVKDNKVRIEIEDTGDGIEQKDIKFIWDRYYKVDKTHKRPISGTGLGLSIVKNILELHGFNYGVISDKGKGSVFYFEADISRIDNI